MTRAETLGKILYRGFVPIILDDELPVMNCLEQMLALGIEAVEISCRNPQALMLIQEAKRRFPDLAVGAATLLEDGRMRDAVNAAGRPVPSVAQVVDAGADFLVSLLPFRQATYERFGATSIIISGVTTPGEGHQALDWGANLLKFSNPHLLGGPDFFKGIDPATYNSFPYFVTGGIKYDNVAGYVAAKVLAFGAGLNMVLGPDYVPMQRSYDPDTLRERLTPYLQAVARARAQYQPGVPFESKDPRAIAAACGRCLNV